MDLRISEETFLGSLIIESDRVITNYMKSIVYFFSVNTLYTLTFYAPQLMQDCCQKVSGTWKRDGNDFSDFQIKKAHLVGVGLEGDIDNTHQLKRSSQTHFNLRATSLQSFA